MVKAVMIIEMMGKPVEHLEEALKQHILKLEKVKHVNLLKKDFHSAKPIPNSDVFTCFCEIEVECENFRQLADIMFDFMPASIEVLEPSEINMDSSEATSLLNNLTGRLHSYDEVAKLAQGQFAHMAKQLNLGKELLEEHKIIKDGKLLCDCEKCKERKKFAEEALKQQKKEGNKEEGENAKIKEKQTKKEKKPKKKK